MSQSSAVRYITRWLARDKSLLYRACTRIGLVQEAILRGWYWIQLLRVVPPVTVEYRRYLKIQLHRSLSRRAVGLPARARHLIDKTVEFIEPGRSRVLCVGCRNTAEIDYFRSKGVQEIVGIDLYSVNKDILVMDMHAMTFEPDLFDVVYSSHSLEHSLQPKQVVEELVRVVKAGGLIVVEVPVNYEIRGADLVNFKSIDNLLGQFGRHVSQVLWQEHASPGTLDWADEVIRVIFRVGKS